MSNRGEAGIRQQRSRLKQQSGSVEKSSAPKRHGNQQRSESAEGTTMSQHLLFREIARNDPSYTPNIEHLVFPNRRNSKSPMVSPKTATAPPPPPPVNSSKSSSSSTLLGSKSKSSRSRLSEVFALSKHTFHSDTADVLSKTNTASKNGKQESGKHSSNASSQKDGTSGGSSGVGVSVGGRGHQPMGRGEGPRKWASEEPVLQSQQRQYSSIQQQSRNTPSLDKSGSTNKAWRTSACEQQTARTDLHLEASRSTAAADMATTRGPNVSILHLRSTSEPWETPSTTTLSNVTRSTSHTNASPTPQTKFNGQTRSTAYASLPSSARHRGDSASQATALFIASSSASVDRGSIINNGTCSRELSPVRWCDREVDGVYLGRSGWVQVQQRSLDENRRANYGILTTTLPSAASIVPTVVTSNTLPNKRPSIRLADYHCSNSEPGKFPDPIIRAEEQHRPAFLPLPLDIMKDSDFEHRVNSKSASPSPHDSSRDIIEDDMMSPPSVTPIISPPPAFQDPNRQVYGTVRRSNGSSKPHFLSRSNAIVDSPPSSPSHIPTTNWSTLPSPRSLAAAAAAVSSSSYFKVSHKVSPITTPTQQILNHSRIPQTKSLEDKTTSSIRRSQFQRYDSSSSSSSSFGFRSLDSNINTRTAMPRLSETDSSVGGYEDGDEEEIITPSKTVPPSLKDVVSLSPDTPTGQGGQIKERSSLVHGDKISPSSLRHANRFNHQRAHPPRRSPGSEGSSGKKKSSNHSTSSTSSSSSSSSLSSCGAGTGSRVVTSASMAQAQAFRRSVSHSLAKQQSNTRNVLETIPHGYHTWDGRNRVRRSRSLQLPETKSPGALSPSSFSNTEYQHLAKQQHQPQHHYPQQQSEPHRVTVKIGGSEQPQERPRRPFIQHRKAQSEDSRYQDGFLRWEDEARAVTDYLHGTRSRAAARALLQAHYHSTTDHGSSEIQDGSHEQQPSGFNIIVVSSRGNKVKTQSQRQQRILQRGITTPTTPGTGTSFDLNPCTPNTCDFWPHCAHRDSLYPPITNSTLHNKSSSLSPGSSSGSKLPSVQSVTTSSMGSSIRLSQTYPSTTKASTSVQRGRSSDSKHIYDSDIKTSKMPEGSVEGHNIYNPSLSDHKNSYQYMHSNRSKNGPNENIGSSVEKRLVTTPENEEKKFKSKSIGRQQHYSHCQTQKHSGNYSSSSEKLKSNVITKASSVISYPTDSEKCDQYKGDPTSAFGIGSGLVFNQQDSGICGKSATSPIMDIQEIENSLSKDSKLSPSGGVNTARSPASSASSSSSDVWVTTSDRTVTKSPRMAQRSSGTSTPQDDALSMGGLGGKSPLQERDKSVLEPRPGSAPAAEPEDTRYKGGAPLDSQQRSLSLPKSFLSERASPAAFTPAEIIIAPKQSHIFSWKPREREAPSVTNKRMKSPSTEVPLTARIPVRDPPITGQEASHYQPPSVISKSIRHNKDVVNIPADDPVASRSDWDIRRPWSNASSDNEPIPASSCRQTEGAYTNQRLAGNKDLSQSQHNLSGAASESVLQKFRKNFAMKFHKKGSKSDADSIEDKTDDKPLHETETLKTQEETTEPSAFAPQQTKDEANVNARFKFGPLVWRSSRDGKKEKKVNANDVVSGSKTEVDTEVISEQTVIASECNSDIKQGDIHTEENKKKNKDKLPLQVDLSNRPQNQHHHHVRRTNSDLSGQRLLNWDLRNNYRRMFSTPSPIKMRPSHTTDPPQNDSLQFRKSKQRSRRPHLRRSISQPLGLNDLSPLMCQRTGAIIMGQRKLNMSSEDEHDIAAGASDDEIMSDSESSITSSLADRKKSFEQGLDDTVIAWAEAVWDHVAMEPEELAFRAGDVIEVIDAHDKDWWWGSRGSISGWFPAAFVRLRVSQENTVEDCLAAMASGATSHIQLRQRASVSLLSNDEVRSRVVRELISTERDFVKILTDVVEGYLKECKKRTEMFSPQHINRIFGNLEELLEFQSTFVNDLENYVDKVAPHKSCIGECFLLHKQGFQIYSEYCNSHPMAIATLQELYERENYSRFFEACRLMRGLMEIPLDGYLLTPVQRICKYPLQLAELLKYTKTDHPDYSTLHEALDTMRNVAILINERKRRMESLEKLAAWQQRVEAWEGEDLIETSTQLIHQGEVTKMTTGMWTSNVTLFLFDHQLIYCKKDILKRNTYVYKGRIQLDTSEVIDVPDGKDPQLGVMMKHGLKVYCYVRDKWLLFCCRTVEEKQAWLDALVEERKLVAKDQLDGLELPPAARQLARMAARCQRRPPNKPRGKGYKRSRTYRNRTQNVSQHNISGSQSSSHSLARIGMWFSFGSNKKGRPVI